jgi:hypothetical protein
MRRTAVCLAVLVRTAGASPWIVTAEGGGEADSNVQHVETGPGIDVKPVAAAVARFGGRIARKDHVLGGVYALDLSALARVVLDDSVSVENTALLAGNLRWMHPVGERPVSLGFNLTAADDLGITDPVGARTFRNLGGDGVIALALGDTRHLTLAAGARQFVYKPDHDFDWIGPTAGARLDIVLWQPSNGTRSLELATTLGYEARAYDSHALANACSPGSRPDPTCFAPTDLLRRDRVSKLGAELTWVGRQVIGLGYQATIIDSNSFGQSLVRHKLTASATVSLPWSVYGTALATLEIDQYLDGLIVETDVTQREFQNLDDENRSSLQGRLGRAISDDWSVEGRVAFWHDLGSNIMGTAFSRSIAYVGAIYSH